MVYDGGSLGKSGFQVQASFSPDLRWFAFLTGVSYFRSRHEVHNRGDQGISRCVDVTLAIDTEALVAEDSARAWRRSPKV